MNRKLLFTAIGATGLALIALLGYSIERTQWLFSLFEDWEPATWSAAIVVELAAVALIIGAGALSLLDAQARAWANRALVAVLSVQALANLTAGYLRGGQQALGLFGANDVPLPWLDVDARYAVAAALWFSVNLAVPGLILCLSKLAERLISAAGTATDAPLREQLASLRETTANDQALLAATTADLAMAREEATWLREQLATTAESARSGSSEAATFREQAASAGADLATARQELAVLRERLAAQDHRAASDATSAANLGDELAAEQAENRRFRERVRIAEDRAATPPSRTQVVAYSLAAQKAGRARSDVAAELGYSESTLREWEKTATNGHAVEA